MMHSLGLAIDYALAVVAALAIGVITGTAVCALVRGDIHLAAIGAVSAVLGVFIAGQHLEAMEMSRAFSTRRAP